MNESLLSPPKNYPSDLPDVLSVKFNTNINTTLSSNCVLITVSRLDTLKHGEHERLKSFVELIVLGLVISIANIIHNVSVQQFTKSLVTAAEQCEKQRKQTSG